MTPLECAVDTSTSKLQRSPGRSLQAFPNRLRLRRWSERSAGKSIQRLPPGQCRTLDGASSHTFCAGHEFGFERMVSFKPADSEDTESQHMPLPVHPFHDCLAGRGTHEPWGIAELNFQKLDCRDHKPRRREGTLTRHSAISHRPASAHKTHTIDRECDRSEPLHICRQLKHQFNRPLHTSHCFVPEHMSRPRKRPKPSRIIVTPHSDFMVSENLQTVPSRATEEGGDDSAIGRATC